MTTYSICKARYSDPRSWRHGTIDAVVFDIGTESTFLYSVVRSMGKLAEVHVSPCILSEEAPPEIPRTFDALREMFEEKASSLDEAMETICLERLSVPQVEAAIKEDLRGVPQWARRDVLHAFGECFEFFDGPRLRR